MHRGAAAGERQDVKRLIVTADDFGLAAISFVPAFASSARSRSAEIEALIDFEIALRLRVQGIEPASFAALKAAA